MASRATHDLAVKPLRQRPSETPSAGSQWPGFRGNIERKIFPDARVAAFRLAA